MKLKTWGDKVSSFFPKFNISKDYLIMYANFMIIVAILGVIPLSLQCWKIYSTQKAGDISIYAFMFQILISTLWVIYALLIGNGVIIISSTLIATAAALIVFLAYKYGRSSDPPTD